MKFNTLTFSRVVFTILLLSLLSPTANARSTPLVNPQPVTINCDLSEKPMQSGIRNGGAVRYWVVVKQDPGQTELNYVKDNKYSINVDINYTKNTFAVTYKNSNNLNYKVNKKGVPELHPNAVKWMANLSGDIERLTNSQCFDE